MAALSEAMPGTTGLNEAPDTKPTPIDWNLVQAQCIRIGWGLGWTSGVAIALIGLAAGAVLELTALRAFLALIAFVLLGWGTGVVLSRFAPEESDESPDLGSTVDMTVGDEDEEPEAELAEEPITDGMESVETEASPEQPSERSNEAA